MSIITHNGVSRVAAAVITTIAGLCFAPTASAEFPFGNGRAADVAVDANGTAHVAWSDESQDSDVVLYCGIPRGGEVCTDTQTIGTGGHGDRVRIMLPASGQVLVMLGTYGCADGPCTLVRRSNDGGQTFGSTQALTMGGDTNVNAGGGAVYGPGDSVSFASKDGRFVNAPLAGGPTNTHARLTTTGHEATVGLNGQTPVVVWRELDGRLFSRAYDGSGDLNDVSNWTTATTFDTSTKPLMPLASGPAGLFILYEKDDQLYARRFVGTGWERPTLVGGTTTWGQYDLSQDTSGRLHAVMVDATNKQVLWRTFAQDTLEWTGPFAIARTDDVIYTIESAAAADGQGFAVWDIPWETAGPQNNMRATPLEALPARRGDACQPPTCEPAGGKFQRRIGDTRVTEEVEIPNCQTRKVTLRVKVKKVKRTGDTVVKVKKVVFQLDQQKRKTDKRPAYRATYSLLQHGLPNSLHTAKAKVHYTIKQGDGKAEKKSVMLKKRFRLCPLA
jgi:hypothetical protein